LTITGTGKVFCNAKDCKLLFNLLRAFVLKRFVILSLSPLWRGYPLPVPWQRNFNKAFYRSGYNYGGRLLNNCHIAGSFENMNIWSKTL